MKEFWNERYQGDEYAYGMAPNKYLKTVLNRVHQKGSVLFPAEGEGRNAVYAAQLGFGVTAIDFSDGGKRKAEQLAKEKGVSITYHVANLQNIELEEESYDILVLIFAHFPPQIRQLIHQKYQKYLKKYGIVILEGFSQSHLEVSKENERGSGPRDVKMLFTKEMIEEDFLGFETIELSEEVAVLNEGEFHQGKSSLIRYMGRKI
ncbi:MULTISPECIES: bifunctional 2-polyprenyl-6-hydroxyphenol methylase/3-demethylubiquinol 3-O-methyltransferase UbiG [unclassified Lentimicrobium]|uniref:class I SAM-dependent methyltransferase n=1 Tax=unclassified Lentimicrobium TaxID=2677434 RepID=UPI001556A3EE|nr:MULTISPECIES: class I SAM-dependent methyltransferase [unclassified Lentimicrobium]NPD44917.1 class I SAM-dependent methyltransferase [Lentimicrobium sp. S6]NPD85888.1 class I SAM-dependent methyltransferase [Lentimicrobium sp. L6]